MLTGNKRKEYYQALITKDSGYEGVFYVGVKKPQVYFADQHVLQENQSLKTASSLKLPKKRYLLLLDLANDVSHFHIQTRYRLLCELW